MISRLHRIDRLLLATLLTLVTFNLQTSHAAEPAHLLRDFSRTQIVIATASGRCIPLDMYVADTPQRRRNGLMYVESMEPYEGMLFIYDSPAEISMWMKNTLLPLDMLFFDTNLRIQHIHRNAEPLSEAIISSNGVVMGVIELNGGAAERLGIQPGDGILVSGSGGD